MANTDDKPYTFADLATKMLSYNDVAGELNKFVGLRDAAKSQMDSHQREIDKLQELVDRRKAEVRRIANNLEK